MYKTWYEWHSEYDDPESGMFQRLIDMKILLKDAIKKTNNSPKIINICAGQARETIQIIEELDLIDAECILIELEEDNCLYAKNNAKIGNFTIINNNAFDVSVYENLDRADIIILSGVLGNMSAEDSYKIVDFLPQIIKSNGYVVWTKSALSTENNGLASLRNYFVEKDFNTIKSINGKNNFYYTANLSQFIGEEQIFSKESDIDVFLRPVTENY